MLPSGSCTDAIASHVASSASCSKTPGTVTASPPGPADAAMAPLAVRPAHDRAVARARVAAGGAPLGPRDVGASESRPRSPVHLLRVDDEALAHDRVQHPVDAGEPPRVLRELPHEEVVVALRDPAVGLVDPTDAPDPPVRRVERVRVVRAAEPEAGALEVLLE